MGIWLVRLRLIPLRLILTSKVIIYIFCYSISRENYTGQKPQTTKIPFLLTQTLFSNHSGFYTYPYSTKGGTYNRFCSIFVVFYATPGSIPVLENIKV